MRHWTVPEANAALPVVRELLAAARAARTRQQEAHDQLEDLRIVGAPPDERARWAQRHEEASSDLEAALLRFVAMGVELKDVDLGLVDFRARLGEHDVFLCWKADEREVTWWHTLDGGFGRRRPIPDFTPVV